MPNTTGTVDCLSISEFSGFVMIEENTGNKETFILWFNPGTSSGIPPQLTSFTRIAHSMWVSLLREAVSNNLSVTVSHPTNSAEVTNVRLG